MAWALLHPLVVSSYLCAYQFQHFGNLAERFRLPDSALRNGDTQEAHANYFTFISYFSFLVYCQSWACGVDVENDWAAIPLFSKRLTSWKREPRVEEPSTTGLLSFRGMGFICVHPTFDPTTKLLSISSIWTRIGRALRLESFKALDPLRIDESIKSPSRYVDQFHLSASCIT